VAQHLVADRVWWFQLWMAQGSPELAPIVHWDPADPVEQAPLTAPELVAGLEATWRMIEDALNRWTTADLAQVFQPPAAIGQAMQAAFGERSRRWIIWHVLEHEMLHTGELSLALGSYGLPGFYGDI